MLNVIYEESNGIDLTKMAIEQMSDSSILNLLDGVLYILFKTLSDPCPVIVM